MIAPKIPPFGGCVIDLKKEIPPEIPPNGGI
jgi:hypothetical protein